MFVQTSTGSSTTPHQGRMTFHSQGIEPGDPRRSTCLVLGCGLGDGYLQVLRARVGCRASGDAIIAMLESADLTARHYDRPGPCEIVIGGCYAHQRLLVELDKGTKRAGGNITLEVILAAKASCVE